MEEYDEDLILPPEFSFTSIRALRMSSRRKIAQFLDLDGVLVVIDDLDVVNNHNGLAELIGFTYLDIRNIGLQKSPTTELLEQWTIKEQCENATVGNLWTFLYKMERFDVLKDCRQNILNDCRKYEEMMLLEREAARDRIEMQMEQDPKVSNSEMIVDETRYATKADVETGKMTLYDAFVCYEIENEDDRKFVYKLIRKLEKERDLRLFVPGRDDLPGSAEHTITAYLIEKRCRRILILMSQGFWGSQVCDFQTKFAHALAPGARSKKLIPVIREKGVPLPRILKFLAVCDFTKSDMEDWVWDRLYTAIVAPMARMDEPDYEHSESSSVMELMNMPYPVSQCRLDDSSLPPSDSHPPSDPHVPKESREPVASSSEQKTLEEPPKQKSTKFPFFRNSSKKYRQEKKAKKAESEILKRNMDISGSRDYNSVVHMPSSRQQIADDAHCKYANERVVFDRNRQSAEFTREPVEHVDSSRIMPESLPLRNAPMTSLHSNQLEKEPPMAKMEQMLKRPAANSSDCNEVTSSTSQIYV